MREDMRERTFLYTAGAIAIDFFAAAAILRLYTKRRELHRALLCRVADLRAVGCRSDVSCVHTSRMFITACKAVNYRVILTQLVTF